MRCHWITVSLLAGRPDLASALVKYEDSFGRLRRNEGGDPFRSFPIPQPQDNPEPPVQNGLTVCKIVGTAQNMVNGSSKVLWQKNDSTSPAGDVEMALQAGSTEVVIEVRNWGNVVGKGGH